MKATRRLRPAPRSVQRLAPVQASRAIGRVLHGERNPQAMALLDALREQGPMTADELREVLGHTRRKSALRYAGDLVAEGLAARTAANTRGRPVRFEITDHGRTVV